MLTDYPRVYSPANLKHIFAVRALDGGMARQAANTVILLFQILLAL